MRAAFVIGSAMDAFCEELKQHNISVFPCGTLEKAVYEAWRAADHENMAESYVLLSPACASFDQFNSFEHRGDVFASLCRDLQANTQTGT